MFWATARRASGQNGQFCRCTARQGFEHSGHEGGEPPTRTRLKVIRFRGLGCSPGDRHLSSRLIVSTTKAIRSGLDVMQ